MRSISLTVLPFFVFLNVVGMEESSTDLTKCTNLLHLAVSSGPLHKIARSEPGKALLTDEESPESIVRVFKLFAPKSIQTPFEKFNVIYGAAKVQTDSLIPELKSKSDRLRTAQDKLKEDLDTTELELEKAQKIVSAILDKKEKQKKETTALDQASQNTKKMIACLNMLRMQEQQAAKELIKSNQQKSRNLCKKINADKTAKSFFLNQELNEANNKDLKRLEKHM